MMLTILRETKIEINVSNSTLLKRYSVSRKEELVRHCKKFKLKMDKMNRIKEGKHFKCKE